MAQNHETMAILARQLLDMDEGALKPQERQIIERCVRRLAVSRDVNLDLERTATFGERIADRVAEIGGSWTFIIVFLVVLIAWMAFNTLILASAAFDPFPYILLNLALSTVAAIQAPIILMSQNRAADRDRLVASHDYEVNLKAEIEIAALHEKLDQIRAQELAMLIEGLGAKVAKG